MIRLFIFPDELKGACDALGRHGIKCDLDSGDRIMVSPDEASEAKTILNDEGIDYDEI